MKESILLGEIQDFILEGDDGRVSVDESQVVMSIRHEVSHFDFLMIQEITEGTMGMERESSNRRIRT